MKNTGSPSIQPSTPEGTQPSGVSLLDCDECRAGFHCRRCLCCVTTAQLIARVRQIRAALQSNANQQDSCEGAQGVQSK